VPRIITEFDWPTFVYTLRSERYWDCSQQELAQMLEVSVSTVSKWERGVVQPQPRHRSALRTLGSRKRYRAGDWPKRSRTVAW